MNKRQFKDHVYERLGRIAQAFGNPRRMEIFDLLANGEKTVERVADETALSVANTSQHLRQLRMLGLLSSRKEGTYVYYSLANMEVYAVWLSLRRLGTHLSPEVDQAVDSFRKISSPMAGKTLRLDSLSLSDPPPQLLDVRPSDEFQQGHIPHALSIPLKELPDRMHELSSEQEVIAYCRGSYCVFADEAVAFLKSHGFAARRLEEGYAEWYLQAHE